jgi:hypothetical protein
VKDLKLSGLIGKIPLKIGLRVEFSKTQGLICKDCLTCSLDCGLIVIKHKGLSENDQCCMVGEPRVDFSQTRGLICKISFLGDVAEREAIDMRIRQLKFFGWRGHACWPTKIGGLSFQKLKGSFAKIASHAHWTAG